MRFPINLAGGDPAGERAQTPYAPGAHGLWFCSMPGASSADREPRSGGATVVTNPGSLRWKRTMASALADAGRLRAYVTTIAATPRLERGVGRLLPGGLGERAQRYLRLRDVPEGVPLDRVVRVAQASTVIEAGVLRASPSPDVHAKVADRASRWFDRAAARALQPGDKVVVLPAGAALRGIRAARALGAVSVLDYTTAHHTTTLELTREEHRLRPDFASTLPLAYFDATRHARMDQEIAEADRILVLSSFARETFVQRGVPEEKLEVTPLGVDLEMFSPATAPREDGSFRILFAGQISQYKGISYLVDAFERAAIPDSELVFLGRPIGPTDAWLSRPGVSLLAPVPIYEMPDVYRSADVYVLPSIFEGFPQTAIMAMACGLPSILSENTFGADVLRDGEDGFIVPIRDPDAIAERLRVLHADPTRRRAMGAAARRRAEDFSWARYGERIVGVASALGG